MVIFADDGQVDWIVKHVGECLGGQEGPSNESVLGRIPERIVFFIQSGNGSGFEVLLGHIFDDVVPVGEFNGIPPIRIADLSIHYFHFDGPLLEVDIVFFAL